MHEHCPCCNLRYSVEPGFFIGAMYVSYAAVVALNIVIGFGLYLLVDPPVWIYAISVGIAVIALLPAIFRSSRVLFLYWFGGVVYNPAFKSKNC